MTSFALPADAAPSLPFDEAARAGDARTRPAALALVAATIASIAAVAFDPSVQAKGAHDILAALVQLAPVHRAVHVVEMAAVLSFSWAFLTLALRVGVRRPAVLAATIAYLAGMAAMLGATLFDGFVTPDVAATWLRPNHEAQAGLELVRLCGLLIQDLATLSWVLQSVGVLAVSTALMADGEGRRRLGIVGLVTGALPLAAVLAVPQIDVAVIIGILLAQAAWNLGCAALLLRR